MESRTLLAAVSWDGGGDGTNWMDPLNWSTDALPTIADQVTIDVPGEPTIRLRDKTVRIGSLSCAELLRVENANVIVHGDVALRNTVVLGDPSHPFDPRGAIYFSSEWFAGPYEHRLSGPGRIEITAGSSGIFVDNWYAPQRVLTIEPDVTISLTNAVEGFVSLGPITGGRIVNRGRIEAAAPGGTLELGGAVNSTSVEGNFDNEGTLAVGESSRMAIGGTFASTGPIVVNDGELELYGLTSSSALASIDRTGGTIRLRGVVDLTPGPLRLDASTGSVLLDDGGRLLGPGIIEASAGAELVGRGGVLQDVILDAPLSIQAGRTVRTWGSLRLTGSIAGGTLRPEAAHLPLQLSVGASAALSDVRIEGDVIMDEDDSALRVEAGIRIDGMLRMRGANATVVAYGDQVWTAGVISFESPTTASILLDGPEGGKLELGQLVQIRGGDGRIAELGGDSGAGRLINRGSVVASDGGSLEFALDGGVLNSGVIEAQQGGVVRFVGPFTQIAGEVVVDGGTITSDQPFSFTGGSLVFRSGTHEFQRDRFLDSGSLNVVVSGTAMLHFSAAERLASLTVRETGRVELASGGDNVLRLRRILMLSGGTIDLADNALIIDHDGLSPRLAVEIAIASARNGGAWDGAGISSSMAGGQFGLATAEAAEVLPISPATGLGSFAGQTVDGTAVLVRYGHNGDANLDGMLNADDYFRIDSGFLTQPAIPKYVQGDFNYDRKINSDDYFLIDSAFIGQREPLGAPGRTTAPASVAASSVTVASSPTVTITPVAPDPRTTPVDEITIEFSEPVMGFDLNDLTLQWSDRVVPWASEQTLTSEDGITWKLSGLYGATLPGGPYTLTIDPQSITGLAGDPLAAGASESFSVQGNELQGTAGDDVIRVRRNGDYVEVFMNTSDTVPTYRLQRHPGWMRVTGIDGDDTITADFSGGDPLDVFDLSAEGGNGNDRFEIVGGDGDDELWLGGRSVHYMRRRTSNPILFYARFEHVAVHGGAGDDTLHLTDSASFQKPQFHGGAGLNTVEIWTGVYDLGHLLPADAENVNLIVNAPVAHLTTRVNIAGPQQLRGLSITGHGSVVMAAGGVNALRVQSLAIAEDGKLHVSDNDLHVASDELGLLPYIASLVKDGRIFSSTATTTPNTGLAVLPTSGAPGVDVKFTYAGDANGDGVINADDYFRIDSGFLAQPVNPSYAQGDFNYDGTISADDYFLIDSAFLGQEAPLAISTPATGTLATRTATRTFAAEPQQERERKRPVRSIFSDQPVSVLGSARRQSVARRR